MKPIPLISSLLASIAQAIKFEMSFDFALTILDRVAGPLTCSFGHAISINKEKLEFYTALKATPVSSIKDTIDSSN